MFAECSPLHKKAVMLHIVDSVTGMPFRRLLKLVNTEEGLKINEGWRNLPESKDTLEPL